MMPDIREVLNALDEADKRLWLQHRTEMRRSFMTAHNAVLGISAWDNNDDAFLDLIDIRLALLFDKSGRLQSTRTVATQGDADKIIKSIMDQNGKREAQNKSEATEATKLMKENQASQTWHTDNGVK